MGSLIPRSPGTAGRGVGSSSTIGSDLPCSSSTQRSKSHSRRSKDCVVYDRRNGRIVSMHQFVGDGTGLFGPEGREERERIARETVKQQHQDVGEADRVVMHAPPDFRPNPRRFIESMLPRTGSSLTCPRQTLPGEETRSARRRKPSSGFFAPLPSGDDDRRAPGRVLRCLDSRRSAWRDHRAACRLDASRSVRRHTRGPGRQDSRITRSRTRKPDASSCK